MVDGENLLGDGVKSQPDWRASPSPARSVSPLSFVIRLATDCRWRSTICARAGDQQRAVQERTVLGGFANTAIIPLPRFGRPKSTQSGPSAS